jgi:hypothetical protein
MIVHLFVISTLKYVENFIVVCAQLISELDLFLVADFSHIVLDFRFQV